ncbi:MAG: hypothetical protein AVDCRST_MAG64-2655 [uncultured Phycisphaerae bacterium]|uniref:Uncharacterized protein n=1 Tax=uncultured Phycisphaerae bacterium TaxID=904963 RepID=A0A6J4PQ98_9BACT|nr:MAG: hypothetical protein AVDCRST_MAG64-2655 [uncultured Phycisphaerae bacterium]
MWRGTFASALRFSFSRAMPCGVTVPPPRRAGAAAGQCTGRKMM